MPLTLVVREANELVCIDIKRLALALLAISARSCRATNLSVERVYTTRVSLQLRSMSRPNFSATLRLMFFSFPLRPIAPGSCPPCPASITTVKRLLLAGSCPAI